MSTDPSITRALGYPYSSPANDFVWREGAAQPLESSVSLGDRTPVLAIGSNRAPEQLRRKFGDTAVVPVTLAKLADHDVVYSAHITSYGSIPATLAPSPGTVVTISLTWLTKAQLSRMHQTEAIGVNYDFAVAEALPIDLGPSRSMVPIGCYLGRRGAFTPDNTPIALAEINAGHRQYGARNQSTMLEQTHARFGEGQDFQAWLRHLINDPAARRKMTKTLANFSSPIDLPAFRIVYPDTVP